MWDIQVCGCGEVTLPLVRKERDTAVVLFRAFLLNTSSSCMWRSRTGTEGFAFTRWKDNTAPLPSLDGCDMTKLYLSKDYGFLDDATADQHASALQSFKNRTPWDVNMDFSTYVVISGFEERTLCYVDEAGPPAWVNLPCFILASLLFLTVPYRIALDRHVAEQGHTVHKLIGA